MDLEILKQKYRGKACDDDYAVMPLYVPSDDQRR